ncbi:hypothetical protein ACFQX6_41730 [Streptosporangium lutulentum]
MIPEMLRIVAVTAGLGLLIAVAGLGLMRLLRRRSIGVMLAVVAVVTVLATVGGVVAVTLKMIIEGESRDIVLSVVAVGGLVGLGVAAVLARRVVAASRKLVDAVQAVSPTGSSCRPTACPPSFARSRRPWSRPIAASAWATNANVPWRSPAASSSPGSATTCAPPGGHAGHGRGPGGRGGRRPADREPLSPADPP